MLTSHKYWSRYDFIIIPALLFLSLILLIKSNFYSSDFSVYITIDFLLTIPVIYFLLIRKKKIPKFTVFSVFVLATLMASYFIPNSDQNALSYAKIYIVPLLEVGVVSLIIHKARLLFKTYKNTNENLDFYDSIRIATAQVFPEKIAHFLSAEITVFYYLFFNWKKTKNSEGLFSYYKEGTYNGVFLGIILVIMIETFVLHFIVVKWSIIAAWILTTLSVYTLLQFLALLKAIQKRPILFNTEKKELILRFGFAGFAKVTTDNIENVEFNSKDIEDEEIQYFSFLGQLSGHNTIIHFKEKIEFESIYGIKKEAKALALIIDDKRAFLNLFSK
ncbi:hypothetical protein ACOSP6_10685 [Tenacibaculum sp. MEBiC06402]|uniref:hypothetical protein n=1 Tax=unclassified Tenacibaculum TaxID=2635139 RepID=UPI003B9D4A4A